MTHLIDQAGQVIASFADLAPFGKNGTVGQDATASAIAFAQPEELVVEPQRVKSV